MGIDYSSDSGICLVSSHRNRERHLARPLYNRRHHCSRERMVRHYDFDRVLAAYLYLYLVKESEEQ